MPRAPLRPCNQPQCPELVASGYCTEHTQAKRQAQPQRQTSAQRGYGSRWQKARATYLRSHPLCVMCKAEHRLTAASVVDHIEPHKGDQAKFWDSEGNWQSLCKQHHDAKTAAEDGGFGNRRVSQT